MRVYRLGGSVLDMRMVTFYRRESCMERDDEGRIGHGECGVSQAPRKKAEEAFCGVWTREMGGDMPASSDIHRCQYQSQEMMRTGGDIVIRRVMAKKTAG